MWHHGSGFQVVLVIVNLLFLIGLSYSIPDIPDDKNGWLKVCNIQTKGGVSWEHYEIQADRCPDGVWLSEPVDGGCVCLNGVWAIRHSGCEDDYLLAYGKGDCFKLEKKIHKLIFIGNPHDAFRSSNFITMKNQHGFHPFFEEYFSPDYFGELNKTVLRLKPPQDTSLIFETSEVFGLFDEDESKFVDEPTCSYTNDWAEEVLLIYKIRSGVKNIREMGKCPMGMVPKTDPRPEAIEKSYKIFPGEALYLKNGHITKASSSCTRDCLRKYLTVPSLRDTVETGGNQLIRKKRDTPVTDPLGAEDEQAIDVDYQPLLLDREFTNDEKDESINVANLRMAKQELNWLLDSKRPPTIDTMNWKLMQRIKEIFTRACPKVETPKFLVDAMMRLFRLFYLDTKDFYPNGHILEERELNVRLVNSLDSCYKEAQNFSFNYQFTVANKTQPAICREKTETMIDDSDNSTAPKEVTKTVTVCICEDQINQMNMTYAVNSSAVDSALLERVNLSIPELIAFKVPKGNLSEGVEHDVPTETMWKLITFTHYYCARYFRDTPADHSALISKMENYFNEDILYRWTKPGRNAFKVWQYLYSAFDLRKFATAVDACVAGAKYISEYPTWIRRPTFESSRRKRRSLRKEKLLSATAYCLEGPRDPFYKQHILSSSSNRCPESGAA